MKQSLNEYDFRNAFMAVRPNNFSYEGLTVLFDALEEYEEGTGEEMELDAIAICCDYTEYESLSEFHKDYDEEDYPDIDSISESTTVICVGDGFIIQAF